MDKQNLVDILLALDEEVLLSLGESQKKPAVVIVGGAAFMLKDITRRGVTHDIDILQADRAVREILSHYPNINGAVAAYMDQVPYNFEDRLEVLDIGAKAITFLTPSTEDMAVMKLYAERPQDIQDLDSAASGQIDWALLDRLVHDPDEAQASALSERRYREMVGAYQRFRGRAGK